MNAYEKGACLSNCCCDIVQLQVMILSEQEIAIDDTMIDATMAAHLLQAEERLRLLPVTQQRYAEIHHKKATNVLDRSWALEDILQQEIMMIHGIPSHYTALLLHDYRSAIARWYHTPIVQQSAFFIRLNILKDGPALSSVVPADSIQLVRVPVNSVNSVANDTPDTTADTIANTASATATATSDHDSASPSASPSASRDGLTDSLSSYSMVSLAYFLDLAKAQNKQLVVLAGSIT
jgi:hypothetical protein